MTSKLYQQSLAGVVFSSSLLLATFVDGASASTGDLVNGLTGQDLLNGGTHATLKNGPSRNISAAELGLWPVAFQPSVTKAAQFSSAEPFSTVLPDGPTVDLSVEPIDSYRLSSALPEPTHVDSKEHTELKSARSLQRISTSGSAIDLMISQREARDASAIAQTVAQQDDTFAPLTDEEIRQLLLIDPNASRDILDRPRATPSSSFLTPTAYGADWGDAFIGIAGATGGNTDTDGSASLGIGFGDAVDNIGVEVSAGIISLDGFAEDGIVGFKLHKIFPQADNLAVAVGWANPIKWGAAEDEEDTFYGVVTKRFALRPESVNQLPLTTSLGVGTGTFRSSGALDAGDNAPNLFGSVSLRVIPQLSVTSSWTGRELGLAASAAPFEFPLVFTAGVSDITDNTAEGTRFQGSMGYSFSF